MNKYLPLVSRIKNGDDNAFSELLQRFENMIYKIINNFNLNRGDYLLDVESLFQEGCIALYNAVQNYDESRGMAFSSYAYMVIRSRIITCIRSTRKKSSKECLSIDVIENMDYSLDYSCARVCDNPPVEYHREQELLENLEKYIAELPKEDRIIFTLRSDGVSYKQIAKLLNVSSKKIDNRIREMRRQLRKLYEEDKL